MRRRMMATYTVLIVLLVTAMGVPLALSFAMIDYHHLAISKINDTARFAVQAVPVLQHAAAADQLASALLDYDARTATAVVVVDRQGKVILTSRRSIPIDDQRWQRRLRQARSGVRSDGMDYPYNLHAEPLFLAEPVESGNETLGAVATISPTVNLRSRALSRGALLCLLMGVAVGIGIYASVRLTRWILRPVSDLDRAAVAVASGAYDVRAAHNSGPEEMRRLCLAFNTMADRLLGLLHAQQSFVADASHQLRNPLAAVRLRVESLEAFVSDDGKPVLDAAVDEVKRLSGILDALLTLAGAQSRQLHPERVDLAQLVADRLQAWAPVADQRNVALRWSQDAHALAWCPPEIIDQVLDVLVDNAVEMSPDGGIVHVWTAVDRSRVEIHVADQGPGMTPEDKARACDRFWRGTASQEREGSGLGLAIATTLLDAAGGTLAFRDVQPRGLETVVRLPRCHENHLAISAVSTGSLDRVPFLNA